MMDLKPIFCLGLMSGIVVSGPELNAAPPESVVSSARAWLEAGNEGERVEYEPMLQAFTTGIDEVIELITPKVIAMTPRGNYEVFDPKTSGDPFRQAESRHDHWVSIEKYTPGPVPVDHLVKEGMIKTAKTREEWLNYSATRERSTFQGARIEIENLGDNQFKATTRHVDSFTLWLHPNMGIDFSRPIKVMTNGKEKEFKCQPSLLTTLQSFERKEDWGLIYNANIHVSL